MTLERKNVLMSIEQETLGRYGVISPNNPEYAKEFADGLMKLPPQFIMGEDGEKKLLVPVSVTYYYIDDVPIKTHFEPKQTRWEKIKGWF